MVSNIVKNKTFSLYGTALCVINVLLMAILIGFITGEHLIEVYTPLGNVPVRTFNIVLVDWNLVTIITGSTVLLSFLWCLHLPNTNTWKNSIAHIARALLKILDLLLLFLMQICAYSAYNP